MEIIKRYDYDYGTRLRLLAELMEASPDKKVRDLQREALKYYPIYSTESIRHWMSIRTAFLAADISVRKILTEFEAYA